MKELPKRPIHKVKYVLFKNWDAIFILGVIILLGGALWKVFPTIEAKLIYNKRVPESVGHPQLGISESQTNTPSSETWLDKTKSFLGISSNKQKPSEEAIESQKQADVITQEKMQRIDETLKDIKDKLREDKELRDISY